MDLTLLAVAAVALLTYPGAARCFTRLRQWLQTSRGRRAYARQQKLNERRGKAAQAALDRERAAEPQQAGGWSFERRTWRR
jgi:hypothetical protein